MAAESYSQAGTALYALGRFDEAAKMAEKAVKYQSGEAKHYFFLAKYLIRSGNGDAALPHLKKAVEIVPEMALGAIADFDLNKTQPILDLLNHLDEEITEQSRHGIDVLKNWPQSGFGSQEVQQLVTNAQNSLEQGNFAQKSLHLKKIKEWELRQPYVAQLTEIATFGIDFKPTEAVQILRENSPLNAEKIWAKKIFKGFILSPELQKISFKATPTFNEQVLLATALGEFMPYSLIEFNIQKSIEDNEAENENFVENCIKHFFTEEYRDLIQATQEELKEDQELLGELDEVQIESTARKNFCGWIEQRIGGENDSYRIHRSLVDRGIISKFTNEPLVNFGLIYSK